MGIIVSQPSKVRRLAKMVIEQTGGGRAIVDFLMQVQSGLIDGCSIRDRIEASKVLLDRGYGKAPLTIEVTGQVVHAVTSVDVGKLSDDDLGNLRRMLRRAVVVPELPAPVAQVIDDAIVEEVGED